MEKTKIKTIAVTKGHGVGESIMDSVLDIFASAGVPLEYEVLSSDASGADAVEAAERHGILFKGPIDTETESGAGSVPEAELLDRWQLYANKTIYRGLPGVPTTPSGAETNLTLVQHWAPLVATDGGLASPALPYAFEVAARKQLSTITVALPAESSAETEAALKGQLVELAAKHPGIEAAARPLGAIARALVASPDDFEVLVASLEQGRLLANIAAGLVGGLEYVPSAHLGQKVSVFETAHGAAHDLVGKDAANPTALLLSGTMMLRQLGLVGYASVIERTLSHVLHEVFRRPDLGQPIPPFRTSLFTHLMCARLEATTDSTALDRQTVTPEPPFQAWTAA